MKISPIYISKPQFFSYQESLWFLDRGYDDCMHTIQGRAIYKAFAGSRHPIAFHLREEDHQLVVETNADTEAALQEARDYVSRWLDLDRDLAPFYQLRDELTNSLQENYHGLRMVTIPDPFEALCWSIIGQQINLSFAYRLKRRFVERYGTKIYFDHRELHLFPAPETVAQLTIEELKDIQFSRQKADYIISLARRIHEGLWNPLQVWEEDNTEAMSLLLRQLRGVGEWTANYVLMKSFGRMDSVPYGDAGLINGIKELVRLTAKPNRTEVSQVLKSAPGWEAYLVFYIWRSLAEPPTAVIRP